MLTFIYITNNPQLARIAVNAGVSRIFVDLEVHGKYERQGHLDTVISGHSVDDVLSVRKSVPEAELMVRLNPVYDNTKQEVEQVLESGADLIMLPMFHTLDEIRILCELVGGRAGIVPLLETAASIKIAEDISKIDGIVELYVGLNDLHLDLNNRFIFEPLAAGLLDPIADAAKKSGMRFGFGGIARVGEGAISGDKVLAEHLRLGSDSVILSRTFYRHNNSENNQPERVFQEEVKKLRDLEILLSKRTTEQIERDHKAFVMQVNNLVGERRSRVQ